MDQIEGSDRGNAPDIRVVRGGERRRHARRSGLWAAQLESEQGARRNCLVLDVSSSGAKLRIEQPAAIGEIVTLIDERLGARRCRIVWAANHRAGITFVDQAGATAGTSSSVPASDPKFLRGRAEVLRRLARSAQGGDAATGLQRLARALEAEAAEIEKQQSKPR